MIIDAHTHITEDGKWFKTNHDASCKRLLGEMDVARIDKSVLLPLAPVISNEFICTMCEEHSDAFIGFSSVEPLSANAVELLEKAVLNYGLKGVKLHPRLQMFRPDDERLVKLYKKIEELKVPIVFDCILNGPAPLSYQLPILYDDVARMLPNTPIILAHFGGFMFLDVLSVANKNKNIYIDTSVSLEYFHKSPFQEQIKFMFEKIGSDRIIYGSDFPEKNLPESLSNAKKIFSQFGIRNDGQRKIFGLNIKRLLSA